MSTQTIITFQVQTKYAAVDLKLIKDTLEKLMPHSLAFATDYGGIEYHEDIEDYIPQDTLDLVD